MFVTGFAAVIITVIAGTWNPDDWHDNGHGGCG